MPVKHSDFKKKRTLNCFLDAAEGIVEQSGFSSLSIRSVAEKAGYNSASIYNYFESFDQLTAFVVIRRMAEFLRESMSITSTMSTLDDYVHLWKVYCDCSFRSPSVFTCAYASDKRTMDNIAVNIRKYFEIFTEKLDGISFEDNPYVTGVGFNAVNLGVRERLVRVGIFSEEDSWTVIEFGHYLHIGLLNDVVNRHDKTPEEYTDIFMKYMVPFMEERRLK